MMELHLDVGGGVMDAAASRELEWVDCGGVGNGDGDGGVVPR